MKENEFTKEEIEINYDLIKKIEKHAQNYESEPDKKNFLRNACAYEQKYILMNSQRPYEVLRYLDDLDLKSSRLILEELNYVEIKKLLSLFTHEDKNAFYKTFSDLSLINQFLEKDKHAMEHVKELPIKRRVEILNSSSTDTMVATTIVYESIPPRARVRVANNLTNVDAISALDQTSTYKEDKVIHEIRKEHINEKITEKSIVEVENKEIKEALKEEFEEKIKEQHKNELKEKEFKQRRKEFFRKRLQHYKENNPEFKDLDFDDEELYEKLTPELRQIVEKDFEEQDEFKLKEEEINLKVENKYNKTSDNIQMLKNSNIKDFVVRMNCITIFNEICSKNEEELKEFEEKCPKLYENLNQYIGKPEIFNELTAEEQKKIVDTIQNDTVISNQINKGLDSIKNSLSDVIKSKFEIVKESIFEELIENKPEILQELNIEAKKGYNQLSEDEKLRIANYFSNDVEIAKKLKKCHDELERDYNLNAKCVKDDVSFSDLLLAVSDRKKFRSYLTSSLVDDNVLIDSNGNLIVESVKDQTIENEFNYEKYSIIGNGEKRFNLVSNIKLLNEFENKKQNCENEEVSEILNLESKKEENTKTL